MRQTHFILRGFALAPLVLASWGCGSGAPSVETSNSEAKVTGTIKVHGKPMHGGEITFDPANYQRTDATPRIAKVGLDGTYEISTLVGQNSISVTGPAIDKEPELGYAAQTFDVQSGANTFDVELPPKE